MWVFLNDAALSIVADRGRPDRLLVRARVAGDITAVFPGVSVESTPDADYRYRASLPRMDVAEAISKRLAAVTYPNFKDSCDRPRHEAYRDVWAAWHRAARELDGGSRP